MQRILRYEGFVNESIDTTVRAKIAVCLRDEGIQQGEDYEFRGGEFIARNLDTAHKMADACAGKFRVRIHDERETRDGGVPVMIVRK